MDSRVTTVSFSAYLFISIAGCAFEEAPEADADPMNEPIAQDTQEIHDLPYSPDDGGGSGSGSGSGSTTTTTTVDTSSSYLDAAARTYLTAARVADAGSVGATQWVNACRVRAYQGAVTFNSGVTRSCTWANTRPGWIILEADYDIIENHNNRGTASVSATNGPVTINTTQFGSKFDGAISLAISDGNLSAQTKLELEYQRLDGYSYSFNGTGNQIVAMVTANGGAFRTSTIEIQAKAKLLRIY